MADWTYLLLCCVVPYVLVGIAYWVGMLAFAKSYDEKGYNDAMEKSREKWKDRPKAVYFVVKTLNLIRIVLLWPLYVVQIIGTFIGKAFKELP